MFPPRFPLEDFDFFVRDAVPVRIAVVPEVKCVGDSDHDPVVQRQDHAGKEQIVDKHGALVISSVTIGVLMARDPAFRFLFTGGIRGLHISPHFHGVQYAVSIPGHGDRFLDMRFAQDELKGIAFGQFNRFAGIFNREKALLVDFVPEAPGLERLRKIRQAGKANGLRISFVQTSSVPGFDKSYFYEEANMQAEVEACQILLKFDQ